MKVITSGDGRKGWAKEFTCAGTGNGGGGCGAVLLVEADDLFKTHNTDYGGGYDSYTTFRCPECNVLTDVTVPSSVYVRNFERKITDDRWK